MYVTSSLRIEALHLLDRIVGIESPGSVKFLCSLSRMAILCVYLSANTADLSSVSALCSLRESGTQFQNFSIRISSRSCSKSVREHFCFTSEFNKSLPVVSVFTEITETQLVCFRNHFKQSTADGIFILKTVIEKYGEHLIAVYLT